MTSKNQIRINKSTTISKTSKSLIINEEIVDYNKEFNKD